MLVGEGIIFMFALSFIDFEESLLNIHTYVEPHRRREIGTLVCDIDISFASRKFIRNKDVSLVKR